MHIFNPEHDIVLALDAGRGFMPPKAARRLRHDLRALPAVWAANDDDEVSVWGWDAAVVAELTSMGVARQKMPTDEQLRQIRRLSNRSLAVEMLSRLRAIEGTTGASAVCHTIADVQRFAQQHGATMLKAPWSSSGRGVKYFNGNDNGNGNGNVNLNLNLNANANCADGRWIENTIARQGTIIAERMCSRVMDFALEYEATKSGSIKYRGLSLFDTVNGAYRGNLLMTEEEKRQRLCRYVREETLEAASAVIKEEMSTRLSGIYSGPFGVDMMICNATTTDNAADTTTADNAADNNNNNDSPALLNPCIEINLRRTMGHVALALTEQGHRGTMAVIYDKNEGKYKLTINQNPIL